MRLRSVSTSMYQLFGAKRLGTRAARSPPHHRQVPGASAGARSICIVRGPSERTCLLNRIAFLRHTAAKIAARTGIGYGYSKA